MAAPAPAAAVSKEQEEEWKEAFNLFDRDGDGKIASSELGTLMRSLGACPTEQQVRTIIAQVDPQAQGTVAYAVFREVMIKNKDSGLTEDQIREAFRVFDKDGKGLVPAAELRRVLTTVGGIEKLSNEEADDMIKEANVDANGMINYIEFSKKLVQF